MEKGAPSRGRTLHRVAAVAGVLLKKVSGTSGCVAGSENHVPALGCKLSRKNVSFGLGPRRQLHSNTIILVYQFAVMDCGYSSYNVNQ